MGPVAEPRLPGFQARSDPSHHCPKGRLPRTLHPCEWLWGGEQEEFHPFESLFCSFTLCPAHRYFYSSLTWRATSELGYKRLECDFPRSHVRAVIAHLRVACSPMAVRTCLIEPLLLYWWSPVLKDLSCENVCISSIRAPCSHPLIFWHTSAALYTPNLLPRTMAMGARDVVRSQAVPLFHLGNL